MNPSTTSIFRRAEQGSAVPKDEFKQREKALRLELLDLQRRLRRDRSSPVLIDFAGVSGGGKSTTTSLLNEWMDPRRIHTHGYFDLADTERQRPEFWRFWRDLPPRGEIGIYLSGRYSRPLLDHVRYRIDGAELERLCARIDRFETALVRDGAVVIKFWMHLNREVQARRLRELENDPLRQWRVNPVDWENWNLYERFIESAGFIISNTHRNWAPWHIIDAEDFNHRSLMVGEIVRDALKARLDGQPAEPIAAPAPVRPSTAGDKPLAPAVVAENDSLRLSKSAYKSRLEALQARLAILHGKAVRAGRTTVLVFEGSDAGGKGGVIRRMVSKMDARTFRIHPIGPPTRREHARQYLWRFWIRLPREGRLAIFDRSWYGRVLVERIEGFATGEEWGRAFEEINDFETQLVEHGITVHKFWLDISKEEQVRRFRARETEPHKQWKLTEEDWRNHERWDEYVAAVDDMVRLTSTPDAPWTRVPFDDKPSGRIAVLEKVCERLERAAQKFPPPGQA